MFIQAVFIFWSLVGSNSKLVIMLPILPQHPFSVISILFKPKVPRPAMNAICLCDQSLTNFSLSKLYDPGIAYELAPIFSSSSHKNHLNLKSTY